MKKRVQVDSSLLCLAILLTGVLYRFPSWYLNNLFWDKVLVFGGMVLILKGIFLRMAARGHKKAHSREGHGLVSTGLYAYLRNPMYLGSFLIGAGFLLVAWPFWLLPVYAVLFYWRFNRQMVKEEQHLAKAFPAAFAEYCQRVPRLFPRWEKVRRVDLGRTCPRTEVWSTKERRTLYWWPLVVMGVESVKEKVVFGSTEIGLTAAVVFSAIGVFFLGLVYFYGRSGGRHAKNRA